MKIWKNGSADMISLDGRDDKRTQARSVFEKSIPLSGTYDLTLYRYDGDDSDTYIGVVSDLETFKDEK